MPNRWNWSPNPPWPRWPSNWRSALPPPQAATALDFVPGEARLKGISSGNDSAIAEKLRASGYSVRTEGNLLILQPATGAAL